MPQGGLRPWPVLPVMVPGPLSAPGRILPDAAPSLPGVVLGLVKVQFLSAATGVSVAIPDRLEVLRIGLAPPPVVHQPDGPALVVKVLLL